MTNKGSFVQIPRDRYDIAKLTDPGVFDEFLDHPPTFIAELITGILGEDRKSLAISGGRIVQAIAKARFFQQWSREFKRLREKERIPDDFAEKKYGFQTWVELMSIIDEDSPDPDRLEALKAMFLSVNQAGVGDAERTSAYQLWQITKQLRSGELLLLKAAFENLNGFGSENRDYQGWKNRMSTAAGFVPTDLVDLYEKRLAENLLMTGRYSVEGKMINPQNARLTQLGIRLCQNIETYSKTLADD